MEDRTDELKIEFNSESSMDESLEKELARTPTTGPAPSAPVQVAQIDSQNVWTMEIYEGTNVRLEAVTLPMSAEAAASGNWNVWNLFK